MPLSNDKLILECSSRPQIIVGHRAPLKQYEGHATLYVVDEVLRTLPIACNRR
jgi:hypothetical protein